MNKILIIILLSVYGVNAQTLQIAGVEPLESYHNYRVDDNLDLSDVNYFKDVNNHLGKFVGTWTGTFDNKTLELQISIIENVKGVRISFDKLLIKYKLTDSNGNEIFNTLPYFDDYNLHMRGRYFGNTTNLYFAFYAGEEWECNQKGTAFINFINTNTITLWILPDSDMIGEDCPSGNVHILPTTKATRVTLTKQ